MGFSSIADPEEAWNTRPIEAALLEALEAIMDCPYTLDEATIPKAGIEANANQVVGNMSVSLVKVRNARAVLALATGLVAHESERSESDVSTDV